MNNFFIFDNITNTVKLDEFELLLVKEFEKLWDIGRNKCKSDSTGIKRLKAHREFKYIYLALDFKSPYFEFLEQERHKSALEDSGLSKEEFDDPDFRAACRKYIEIKDSSRILTLIKTAHRTLEKTRIFLDSVDLGERDITTNKYINDPKKILDTIGQIGTLRQKLIELEDAYKKDLSESKSKLRGDNERGFMDE